MFLKLPLARAAAKGHMEETAGASPVSSDTSSAPASGTAASSTAHPADASTSAGSGANEAAASTQTGAATAPDTAADLDEAALDAQLERAIREAPEDDEEEADPEAETPTPEPKGEEKTEDTPEPEDAPEADADPLAEFEADKIPTREEIDAKHARAPKAIREEFAETAERLAAREEAVSRIGGDEGLKVAEAIAPHLFTAEPTAENATGMFEALVDTNPALVAQMGSEFINAALNDEKTGPAFADRLLEGEFGEGYTRKVINELIALDKEGLIDRESLREDLGTGREPTARERDLQTQLEAAQAQVKQLSGDNQDATRKAEQSLQSTLRSSISDVVMAKVNPIAEKVGWVGEGMLSRLGALASAELNQQIEQTPEYAAVQALVEGGQAFRDGKPTTMMRVKLDAIGRRSEAMFLKTVRELKPLLDSLAGKKSPATKPPTPGTSRSGDEQQQAPPPPRAPEQPKRTLSLKEQEAALDRQFDSARRDAHTASSRR